LNKALVTASGSGIIVNHQGKSIALDPTRNTDCDVTFVSHAHMDHLHSPSESETILASYETARIAGSRGFHMPQFKESIDGLDLVDAGHILGSRGLLIENEVFYTGDVCTRSRAFLKGAAIPECDTLILESTYGKPEFKFPSVEEVIENANKIISNLYTQGIPVILLGYPLGKAQILTSMFRHWSPIYLHDMVHKMNHVYEELGIDLGEALSYSEAEKEDLLSRKPWLMVAPRNGSVTSFIAEMKERYSAVTIGFSGWALTNWYRYSSMLDYALPLSDHCDFDELASIVRRCSPSKVYTFHGYSMELAAHLNKLGYDAEPLVKGNHRLSDFMD
jgi:putative mRNA 3-end processing factor